MKLLEFWPGLLLIATASAWSWHELRSPLINNGGPAPTFISVPPSPQDKALRAKMLSATRIDVQYADDTMDSSVVVAHLTPRDLREAFQTIRLDPKDTEARDAVDPYNKAAFYLDFYRNKKMFCYLTLSRNQDLGTLCYDVEPTQMQTYYALQRASVARLKNALWNNPTVAKAMNKKP